VHISKLGNGKRIGKVETWSRWATSSGWRSPTSTSGQDQPHRGHEDAEAIEPGAEPAEAERRPVTAGGQGSTRVLERTAKAVWSSGPCSPVLSV